MHTSSAPRVLALALAAGFALPFAHADTSREDALNADKAADQNSMKALTGTLPTDPRLLTGELDNGLKYIVLRHANPPGRFAVWLHVDSGSLNETDKQQGIAHYLEHMAFNGSENFAAGTLIPFFESIGLTFGRHQNAFTSFDQTTYQLSLQDCTDMKVDKAMLFMADVATRLSLLPKEIDEERKVILNEKRARLSPQQRVQEEVLKRTFPGSLFSNRIPIGTEETLLAVQQQDFKDYYNAWYVPSNMTVIVVADTDPAPIIEKIKKSFSGGTKKPLPVDANAVVAPNASPLAVVVTDAEVTNASISFGNILPPDAPTTTYELLRERMVESLATEAFNRRMDAKINAGEVKCLGANADASSNFRAFKQAEISFRGEPKAWNQLLKDLGTETQRARIHGFTKREIDDVVSEIISGAELAVQQESTRPAQGVIGSMNGQVADAEPIMSAAQRLAAFKGVLPSISASEVNSRFTKLFDPAKGVFVLTAPTSANAPSEAELLSLGTAALDVKPDADIEKVRAASLMAKTPKPGAISDVATHKASGVTSARLSNGVRVHYKFMDIRKDNVSVNITMAGGTIQEAASNRGVAEAAGLAFSQPATSTLTSKDITDLTTGKKVGVGGSGGGMMAMMQRGGGGGADAMTLSIDGAPADIETGFQVAHLLLTDPKLEQSAVDRWKEQQKQFLGMRQNVPMGAFAELMMSTVYPKDDARTQLLTAEQIDAVNVNGAQSFLASTIKSAPIEVSIVGDIPQERAMELVATYLGSLPQREAISGKTLDSLRTLVRPKGPISASKEIATQTKQAQVMCGFYGADADNIPDTRALQMAARTISSRMVKEIREKEQLVYSINATHRPGNDWPGFGMFSASAPTDPAKVTILAEKIKAMYDEFAASGPTEEEMTTAKKQMANEMDDTMKQPGFWSGRLSDMDYRGRNLDDVVAAPDYYQNLSAMQVQEAFKKYYKPESLITAWATPKAE